jgi:hypothetical protein
VGRTVAQEDLKEVLAGIARSACRSALEMLTQRVAALDARPSGLDGYMEYGHVVAAQAAAKADALAAADAVHDMYETLVLNGGKVDSKDDIRRDDMAQAAAAYVTGLADGAKFLTAGRAAQQAALLASRDAAAAEAASMSAEVAEARYATFESDVDVVVEDLRERVAALAALRQQADAHAAYARALGLPEVRLVLLE